MRTFILVESNLWVGLIKDYLKIGMRFYLNWMNVCYIISMKKNSIRLRLKRFLSLIWNLNLLLIGGLVAVWFGIKKKLMTIVDGK